MANSKLSAYELGVHSIFCAVVFSESNLAVRREQPFFFGLNEREKEWRREREREKEERVREPSKAEVYAPK